MRIPLCTARSRFYVAVSESEAISSWPSFPQAQESFDRLREAYPEEAAKVTYVVELGPGTRRVHRDLERDDICTCARARPQHACPYQSDVNDNDEPYCSCCPKCAAECADNI